MIRAILATNFNELNQYITTNITEIDVATDDIETQMEALDFIRESKDIDVILLSDALRGDKGLVEFLEIVIEEKETDTKIYYLAKEYPGELTKALAKYGISYFKQGTQSLDDFVNVILKEGKQEKDKDIVIKTQVVKEVEYRSEIKSVFKEVFTVYSPLGQGASTFASHFALALAEARECRVNLSDLDPLKPRLKEIHAMDFDFSLGDAIDSIVKGNLTTERLEEITKQSRCHKRLDLLCGLYDITDYYATKREQYEELIDKLKFCYDYVVLDTNSWYDVLSSDAALKKADRVIVPVRGNQYSIDQLHKYLEMFDKYQDYDTRKFGIVITQYSSRDLTCMEIGAKLKYPILGYISKYEDYQEGNGFKNKQLMNEYVDILKALGIQAKKKRVLLESIPWIGKRKTVGQVGS